MSGSEDYRRRRIKMPVGVDHGLRAEAADAQNESNVLERFHLTISVFGAPKSR
jgi:hypothetical protein